MRMFAVLPSMPGNGPEQAPDCRDGIACMWQYRLWHVLVAVPVEAMDGLRRVVRSDSERHTQGCESEPCDYFGNAHTCVVCRRALRAAAEGL